MNTHDEIWPGLWQGAHPVWYANDIPKFDLIVSLSRVRYEVDVARKIRGKTIHFACDDIDEIPEPHEIRRVARAVAEAINEGKKVLVHCDGGFNRSGLVAVRALMYLGIPAKRAITIARKRRGSDFLFNRVFENWVLDEPVGGV